MAQATPQNCANHARFVPGYHIVAFLLLLLNLAWSVVVIVRHFSPTAIVNALTAVALLLLFWYARGFAVGNQDRIIRLEMKLRMEQLLPPDLAARIGEFAVGQLVALRFASDAELPALARKVLDEKITDRKLIKQQIREWVADYQRV